MKNQDYIEYLYNILIKHKTKEEQIEDIMVWLVGAYKELEEKILDKEDQEDYIDRLEKLLDKVKKDET
jgi:predicted transcriptional regulator